MSLKPAAASTNSNSKSLDEAVWARLLEEVLCMRRTLRQLGALLNSLHSKSGSGEDTVLSLSERLSSWWTRCLWWRTRCSCFWTTR